jgi:hypothetical protein
VGYSVGSGVRAKLVTALSLGSPLVILFITIGDSGVVMSGEDAPRPYLENLIVLEIKTKKLVRRRNDVPEETPRYSYCNSLYSQCNMCGSTQHTSDRMST